MAAWQRHVLFFLITLPVSAQTTFKSNTNLVEVTAIVRDSQGQTVGTLTATDFELFDNNHRQVISRFEVQRRATSLSAPSRTSSSPAPTPSSTLPNHFVAFVVDDQNLIPENFTQSTIAAIHHLADLRPGDRAAVLSTSGSLLLPYTSDREQLRRAFSSIGSLGRRITFDVSGLNSEITCRLTYLKADRILDGDPGSLRNCVPAQGVPRQLPPVADRPTAGLARGVPGEIHQIWLENQVRTFAESIVQTGDRDTRNYFNGLGQLIATMSRLPGERTIIVLSPGMYVPHRLKKLQDETIANAVRAQVVISGVDPRGVYVRNDPDDPSTWTDPWGLAETNERIGFMEGVTSGTGGTFIHGNNDIDGALRRLDGVPEFAYVLGFSPTQLEPDSKYHALKVTLKPSRGLTVYARRGYYGPGSEPDSATQQQRQTEDAFFSGRQSQDLPVTLQIRSSQKPNVSIVLTAIAQIDLHKLPFRKQDSLNRNELTLGIGLFDHDGKFLKDSWKSISLTPADDQIEPLRSAGFEIKTDFDVGPGQYMVRVVVRDSETNAIGTQSTAVNIRP